MWLLNAERRMTGHAMVIRVVQDCNRRPGQLR
jgi:hypothetical protein